MQYYPIFDFLIICVFINFSGEAAAVVKSHADKKLVLNELLNVEGLLDRQQAFLQEQVKI